MASQSSKSKSKALEWSYLYKNQDGRIYCKECDKNCGTLVTRARDRLLGIVGGLGGVVKRCEKIKPEVRESLREEIESHKNINYSHASKKRKVQDALMGQEVISTPSRTSMTSPISCMPYGSERKDTLPYLDSREQTLKQAWKPLKRKEVDDSIYIFLLAVVFLLILLAVICSKT